MNFENDPHIYQEYNVKKELTPLTLAFVNEKKEAASSMDAFSSFVQRQKIPD